MIVRYPALLDTENPLTSRALVSNIDIAPTLAELAGFPWKADGRSLVPLLDGSARSIRSALLIEHCQGVSEGTPPCSGLSFYAHITRAGGFRGVVTPRYKYVRYDQGSRELFDLQQDPAELENLIGAPGSAATIATLRSTLATLGAPAIDTTIVTGPWPALDGPSRSAAFTFFSPSRFSTYRCRLIHDGTAGPWHTCDGGPMPWATCRTATTCSRSPAPTRRVAWITPASRSFTIASSGPTVSIGGHPPSAQRSGGRELRVLEPGQRRHLRVPPVSRRRSACSVAAVHRVDQLPESSRTASGTSRFARRLPARRRGPLHPLDGSSASTAPDRRSPRRRVRPAPRRRTGPPSSSFRWKACKARPPAGSIIEGPPIAAMGSSPPPDCPRVCTRCVSQERTPSATSA